MVGISRITGELELTFEQHDNSTGTPENRRSDKTTIFEQRLNLRTTGDVYNPNFLVYNAGLGLGLVQHKFESNTKSDKSNGTLETFNITMDFLKEKKYPFSIYLSRSDSLFPQRFQEPLRVQTDSSGLTVSAKNEDWPMLFQWSKTETRQTASGDTQEFFNRIDERFKFTTTRIYSEYSKLKIDFERDDVIQDRRGSSTNLVEDSLTVSHDLIFGSDKQHRLNSFFNYLNQTGTFKTEMLRFDEFLELQHTYNFSTNYSLGYTDIQQRSSGNRQIQGQAGFNHQLYENLTTTGSVFASKIDMDNGEVTRQSGNLAFSYQRANPWGTIFASYRVVETLEEHSGGGSRGIIVDEVHTFTESFITLNKTGVDVNTIRVSDDTGEKDIPEFTFGDDYDIEVIGGDTRVRLVGVDIAIGDTVYVSYDFLTEPGREETVLDQRFTLRQRFNNGLSIYYKRQRQDQKISAAQAGVAPDEFVRDTYGIEYFKKGLKFLAEHSDERSTSLPSVRDRLEANYRRMLSPVTTMFVRASKQWLSFGAPDNRDMKFFTAGGEIFTRLSDRLGISGKLDYRDETDTKFGSTEGLAIGTEVRYDYRLLSVKTGAEFNSLVRNRDERENTFVYLKVKRKF